MILSTNKQQNPNNPTNSAIIQALLDAQLAGTPDLENAIKYLQSNAQTLKKADAIHKSHQYPNKAITYVMSNNSTVCNIRQNLSPNAVKMLDFYIAHMYINNCVSCTKENAMLALSMSKPTYLATKRELLEYNCIVVARKYSKGHKEIIMVNPEIAYVGKNKDIGIDNFWCMVEKTKNSPTDENSIRAKYSILNHSDFVNCKMEDEDFKFNDVVLKEKAVISDQDNDLMKI